MGTVEADLCNGPCECSYIYVYEQKGDFPYMSIERKRLMKRVLIIGPNCSGKTTFSRRLRDKLAIPLVHLDSLYWLDNWEVGEYLGKN